MQEAILKFDRDTLIGIFDEFGAAVAACNNIAEIFEDPHFAARGNIVAVDDAELNGPLKMQNVVGNFSRTPGKIKHAGPKLGEHNKEIFKSVLNLTEEQIVNMRSAQIL